MLAIWMLTIWMLAVRRMAVGHMLGRPVGVKSVCDVAVIVFMDGNRVHDTAWANAEKREAVRLQRNAWRSSRREERYGFLRIGIHKNMEEIQ